MEVIHQFDPLDDSAEENREAQVKVILEDADVVECEGDAEGVSEEEDVQYHLCEIADTNDKTVAYRVVRVGTDCENHPISSSTIDPGTVQVLTTHLNDQFYVLSDGGSILPTETPKSELPRVTRFQMETTHETNPGIKKKDERRRMTHNEVERRRRDKINTWISKLGKLLPDCDQNVSAEGDMKSKGGILARACEHITELKEARENLTQSLDENAQLMEEAKNLRKLVTELKKENAQLKTQFPIATSSYILGT